MKVSAEGFSEKSEMGRIAKMTRKPNRGANIFITSDNPMEGRLSRLDLLLGPSCLNLLSPPPYPHVQITNTIVFEWVKANYSLSTYAT